MNKKIKKLCEEFVAAAVAQGLTSKQIIHVVQDSIVPLQEREHANYVAKRAAGMTFESARQNLYCAVGAGDWDYEANDLRMALEHRFPKHHATIAKIFLWGSDASNVYDEEATSYLSTGREVKKYLKTINKAYRALARLPWSRR